MLKRLYLENFKSIRAKTTIEFSPLTVFAGSNSSGKSTLLQSILLLAQTVQSSVYRRYIVLNGSLARLGTFNDILSAGAEIKQISIGFDLKPDNSESALSLHRRNAYFSDEQLRRTTSVHFSMKFSGGASNAPGVAQLQPELEKAVLKYAGKSENGEARTAELAIRRRRDDIEKFFSREKIDLASISSHERSSFAFEVEQPTTYRPRWGISVESPKSLGVHLQHFLPRFMSFTYDAVEEQCNSVYRMLTGSEAGYSYSGEESSWPVLASNPEATGIFLNQVNIQIEKHKKESGHTPMFARLQEKFDDVVHKESTAESLRAFMGQIPGPMRQQIRSAFAEPEIKAKLFAALKANQKEDRRVGGGPLPDWLDFSGDYVQSFFSERIRYLGPLRDEPKPIYPYGGSIDSLDVGIKGESTAAVLDLHKDTEITYIPSRAVKAAPGKVAPQRATLLNAVLDWLEYMGVAGNLQTSDQGKLGHELRVSTLNSQQMHDLTHVGVGVSQVLPILVQALLVEPGSCLIFEQPELHLHPKVQTKLADFFVSVTTLGKQCIIETHSEYLINELRYLSALADDDDVSDLSTVYFVQKHADGSCYEKLKFNEFGVISNWPDGFFDESEEIAAQIIKAAMQKRTHKNKK
jgi:predicted ATPase